MKSAQHPDGTRAQRRGIDPLTQAAKLIEGRVVGSLGGAAQRSAPDEPAPAPGAAFLAALGVRADALTPTRTDPALPRCPLCGAEGIAGYAFDAWAHMAHACACDTTAPERYDAGLRVIARRLNALPDFLSALPDRYREYTAATLTRTPGNAKAMRHVAAGALTENLYLFGAAGNGKTHLAVAAARKAAQGGQTARFWGMASLIKALRESSAPGSEVARPQLHHWDVLVIDDIDKIKPTAFVYEAFYELIEARWAARKVTIFTAQSDPNDAALMLTPEGAARAADPLASRLASGTTVRIEGEDRRSV